MGSYYLGLCFLYGDKMESIPQIGRAEGLEFGESRRSSRKLTVKKKKIAFHHGPTASPKQSGLPVP